MKAKHNNTEILITYVSPDLTWALVTKDLEGKTGKYKVDVIELEDFDQFELEELANQK